jgi:hypothetical protein
MWKNVKRYRDRLRGLGARIILAAVFLVGLGGESAFGSAYSDIWVVSYGGSNVIVKACGVTDESYTGYNHEFSITSTIYSPNGRTVHQTFCPYRNMELQDVFTRPSKPSP